MSLFCSRYPLSCANGGSFRLKVESASTAYRNNHTQKKRPLESSKRRWKQALQNQCGIIPLSGDDDPHDRDGGGNHPGAVRAASLH